MNTTVAQPVTLVVSRLIKAPRERVFAAWTKPAELMKWFGPEGCDALSAKLDARPGGEFIIHMKTCEMGEADIQGIYREVKAPSKLVFTWNWKNNANLQMPETLVTVDFLDRNGSTEVKIVHDYFPNNEARENHEHGWNGCLDKMEKVMVAAQ